jgi:hypothetical protein
LPDDASTEEFARYYSSDEFAAKLTAHFHAAKRIALARRRSENTDGAAEGG